MLHCPIGTYTSPMYLPCWSMWTVNVMVDIPISNQHSLENVCTTFLRCLSARLERDIRISVWHIHLESVKCTYYRRTFSGFPSALRVSRPNSISAFSSTDSFINANLA